MLTSNRLCFLSVAHEVAETGDWNRLEWTKLWLYNLHYFDDLNADDAHARTSWHKELIARWVAENPPVHGNGWEPYPTSMRIVNWIKWALAGNEMRAAWLDALAIQARWLAKRLEYHLLGNHLFANAKALVFAGSFFSGSEAEAWRKAGMDILLQQVPGQILHDGGHFERSPMYHAIACEDLLDLVQLAKCFPTAAGEAVVDEWIATVTRMLDWLTGMSHPDGNIALFNDAALGIAPTPKQLNEYAYEMGVRSRATAAPSFVQYPDTGYVRAARGPALLFCDVAPIGPDYVPGHGHADTLTFELSLFGARWIVDCGCSTYEVNAQRLRERGTAAHNTVTVDDLDSSEVWASFRVGRRSRVLDVAAFETPELVTVSARHDGYQRLPGRVGHRRTWQLAANDLTVVDELTGRYRTAVGHLLLHPDIEVTRASNQLITLRHQQQTVALEVTNALVRVARATWHPKFGHSIPTSRVSVTFAQPRVTMRMSW